MALPKILKTKITRENFALTGILIILIAIPLTVILLGIRQELRKRAAGENGSILINNGDEITRSPEVTLTLTAPTQSSAADSNLLQIPQAHAQALPGHESCYEACQEAGYARGTCERISCSCRLPDSQPCGWLSDPEGLYETCTAVTEQTRLTHRCCCYAKLPTPTPTPIPPNPTPTIDPTADYGCTLECSEAQSSGGEFNVGCEAVLTVEADVLSCSAALDGQYGGNGVIESCEFDSQTKKATANIVSYAHNICPEGTSSHSETHTVSVGFGLRPQRTAMGGNPIHCSEQVTVDCPDQRKCKNLQSDAPEWPSSASESRPHYGGLGLVLPGGQTTFSAGVMNLEEFEGATLSCSDDCGGTFGAQVADDKIEWTAPMQEGKCLVNCSATTTDGKTVDCPTGGVWVTNESPQGIWMRISNYQDFREKFEGPFSSTKTWTLTENDGTKTVWAQFRKGAAGAWTTPVSDSIYLDTHPGGGAPTPTESASGGPTPTPVPVPSGCEAADLNGDGYLDIFDFVVFLETYGQSGENIPGDLDGDGTVTFLDVSIFIDLYQTCLDT